MKRKEEASERMLIEARQLSDIELKAIFIRKLNELTENYQKLQGNYSEYTENYISMEKEIESMNKCQEEMKNAIFELKNSVEEIESRLDEAEDQINELEDKVGKNTQKEQEKEKRLRKNETVLREIQDNMKHNNIRITGIPEGEEEQGIENLFEKEIVENLPNLMRDKVTHPGSTGSPNQEEPKEAHCKTHQN